MRARIPVLVVTGVTGLGGDPELFKHLLASRKQIPPPECFFSKPLDREEFVEKVNALQARPVGLPS